MSNATQEDLEQSERLVLACMKIHADRNEAEDLAEEVLRPMVLEILAELGAPDDAGKHELEEAAKVCAGECARRLAIMTDQELAAAVEAARDMKREELHCALRRFLR